MIIKIIKPSLTGEQSVYFEFSKVKFHRINTCKIIVIRIYEIFHLKYRQIKMFETFI